jgi:hypothetical protein
VQNAEDADCAAPDRADPLSTFVKLAAMSDVADAVRPVVRGQTLDLSGTPAGAVAGGLVP